jgi:hypothetical protein
MPARYLNPEALVVESFPTEAGRSVAARPRTYEPGCTLPELCGTGAAAARPRTYEPGCTLPELCGTG